jgi:hypothetical protein
MTRTLLWAMMLLAVVASVTPAAAQDIGRPTLDSIQAP